MSKKILFLVSVGGFSGAENMSLLTATELINRGYKVYYCAPMGSVEKYINEYCVEVEYVPLKAFNYWEVKRVVSSINPDLIYAVDFKVSVLASFLNRAYIAHLHNNPLWIRKKSIKTLLLLKALNMSVANICVSDSIMDEFVYSEKVRTQTKTILNVIDAEKVKRMSIEDDTDSYDICFVGRLCEQKNPLRFIEIVSLIKEVKKDLSVIMIGPDGGLLDICRKKCEDIDLSVDFTGFQGNPYKYIRNSKIVLMPSVWEGFGLTAAESMVLGKPVLATPVGGLTTVIGVQDRLCKTNEAFVKESIKLLLDESYYNECSVFVSKYSMKFCDIKRYVDSVEELCWR